MYSSREKKNKKEEKIFESIVYPTLPARASVSLLLRRKGNKKKKNRKRTVATKKSNVVFLLLPESRSLASGIEKRTEKGRWHTPLRVRHNYKSARNERSKIPLPKNHLFANFFFPVSIAMWRINELSIDELTKRRRMIQRFELFL